MVASFASTDVVGSTGALAFGLMYLTATVFSFFAPSAISRFPSVRRALAFFSFEFWYLLFWLWLRSIFVGVFAFNIPVLILICSVIHGCFLSVLVSFSVHSSAFGLPKGFISDK